MAAKRPPPPAPRIVFLKGNLPGTSSSRSGVMLLTFVAHVNDPKIPDIPLFLKLIIFFLLYSYGSGEGCSGGAPQCLFPAPFRGVRWSIFILETLLGLTDSRMRHPMTETCQWPQASSPTGSLVQAGRDDLDPPPEVGRRPGGVPALQTKER